MTPQDIQLKYELDMDAAAAAQRLDALRKAAMSGDATAPRAVKYAGVMFDTVRDLLAKAMDVKTRGIGGKYKNWMRRLGPEKAALIAIRECILKCSSANHDRKKTGCTVQRLTTGVGRLYETEVRIMEAEEVNPMYMQRIHDQVKNNASSNVDHLRRLYNVAYDRVMKGELDSQLTDSELAQIGKFGVDACVQAGIIVELSDTRAAHSMVYYTVHDDVLEYLLSYDENDVYNVVDRGAGAMTCPPQDWTNLSDGGYLSVRRKQQFPLMPVHKVRRAERKRIREKFTAEQMPLVFECANYLQSIPYRVHQPTLNAVQRLWASGGGVLGVPTRKEPPKPPFPFPEGWDRETASPEELDAFKSWKHKATEYYTNLKEWRGHTQEIGGFLRMARRSTDLVWFPVMMDTRGRWYYNGTPNPQGSDIAKAMLHFGEKKPLGQRGLFWLKVHIANSLGYDKKLPHLKAAYTDSIWSYLEAALDAPEDVPEVWGKDAPWCVFSAAWELREALRSRNPAAYETGIPIHMDATCSGLQHFSAMLRDEVGGKYVNLFWEGQDEKQDIYRKVAAEAVERLTLMHGRGDLPAPTTALYWIQNGIGRDEAKKPVMTFVYGATLRGTAEHLEERTNLSARADKDLPKGERNCDIATSGAKLLFTGIEKTVPAAAEAMRWLKAACKTAPKGKRMEWTAPTGFKVQHDYQEIKEVRVRLNSCGVNLAVFWEPQDDVNPNKMQNAVAPNFVHALDASHLTFTALAMKEEGLQFVGIHDSFGTHPCDVDYLHKVLREEFVSMYENFDVLGNFLWEVGATGIIPKPGKLDLKQIVDSPFFFC